MLVVAQKASHDSVVHFVHHNEVSKPTMVCQRAPEWLLLPRLLAGRSVDHRLAAQTDHLCVAVAVRRAADLLLLDRAEKQDAWPDDIQSQWKCIIQPTAEYEVEWGWRFSDSFFFFFTWSCSCLNHVYEVCSCHLRFWGFITILLTSQNHLENISSSRSHGLLLHTQLSTPLAFHTWLRLKVFLFTKCLRGPSGERIQCRHWWRPFKGALHRFSI